MLNKINSVAKMYRLDPNLVRAICMQESDTNTWAMRYEPKWRYYLNPKYWARRGGSSRKTEFIAQATSWGLMQVMGTVAREYGFSGFLSELCDPMIGLNYGCKHLKAKIDRYRKTHSEEWAIQMGISAYNAGSARWSGLKFKNQKYVDSVMVHWNNLDKPK